MAKNIARCVIIFLAIIFQTVFIPALGSGNSMPNIVLALVMAWTMIAGFEQTWPWVVSAGLAYDLFSFSRLGSHSAMFIIAAYLVSFLSRRFFVEHRGWGALVSGACVALATVGYRALWLALEWLSAQPALSRVAQDAGALGMEISVNLALFFLLVVFLGRFERFFSYYDKRIIIHS